MKLEWKREMGWCEFAEVENLYCLVHDWNPGDLSRGGDIWLCKGGLDDAELYTTAQNLSADEMKRHLEEKLIEILKVWHDAYEELTK